MRVTPAGQDKRYVATLLYQYAAVDPSRRVERRLCEESMIVVRARSAREALRLSKQHARRRQYTVVTSDGDRLEFELIGVRDLLQLGIECQPEEVWCDTFELVRPMERRAKIIPPEGRLNAVWWESADGKRRARLGGPIRMKAVRRLGRRAQ